MMLYTHTTVTLGLNTQFLSIYFMAVDYLTSPSLYNLKLKQTTVGFSCTLMKLLECHRIFNLFTDV